MSTPLGDSSNDGRPRRDDFADTDYVVERPESQRGGGDSVGELDAYRTQELRAPDDRTREMRVPAGTVGPDGPDGPDGPRASADSVDFEAAHDRFGGIKWGSAFFGWLTATGAIVFLAAIAAGIGALVDQNTSTDLEQISQDPQSAGIVGGVVLGVILFIGYFCGGYVAGRMARFDGARQGVAVWIWALVMAAVFTGLGFLAGDQFNVGSQLSGLPTPPVNGSDRTLAAVIVGASVVVLALVSAILGGKAGMRFHRKVDKAGVTP